MRIYKQDYELLLPYFSKIYPIQDAFDGTAEPAFDVCSYNWIGKSDWLRIVGEIERDLEPVFTTAERRLNGLFPAWVNEALKHSSVIVAEGNA